MQCDNCGVSTETRSFELEIMHSMPKTFQLCSQCMVSGFQFLLTRLHMSSSGEMASRIEGHSLSGGPWMKKLGPRKPTPEDEAESNAQIERITLRAQQILKSKTVTTLSIIQAGPDVEHFAHQVGFVDEIHATFILAYFVDPRTKGIFFARLGYCDFAIIGERAFPTSWHDLHGAKGDSEGERS